MSPRFWRLLGYDPSEKKHLSTEWKNLIFPEDLVIVLENLKKHCESPDHPYDQVVRYKHQDGSTVWVRCRGIAIRDKTGKAIRILGAHNDISGMKKIEIELKQKAKELKRANLKLKELATHDSLTQLLNRRGLLNRMRWLIALAKRTNSTVAVLLLDLDNFKVINDKFGHAEGDVVLENVASQLQKMTRESDIVGRYGGEEFVVVLPNIDSDGSATLAKKLRLAIPSVEAPVQLTASIGIAMPEPELIDFDTMTIAEKLIENADKAMYTAKRHGKNQISKF